MDRPACVNLPAFPLQLLLAERPEWKELPAAVVDRDDPRGLLLAINEKAWRGHLRPGMRYAAALSLERSLRAGVVATDTVAAATRRLVEIFGRLTPGVDVSREEAGVFWLDGRGLGLLYASASAWGRTIQRAVAREGWEAVVVVGFTRFGAYAVARRLAPSLTGTARNRSHATDRNAPDPKPPGGTPAAAPRRPSPVVVLASAEEERRAVHATALECLEIDPTLLATFERLAVRTVGDLLRLPPQGIRRRFGEEAWKLHERASGRAWDPLSPAPADEPSIASVLLEEPVTNSDVLLLLVRRLLAPLLERMAARQQAAAAIRVALHTTLKRTAASAAERRDPAPTGRQSDRRASASQPEPSGDERHAAAPTSFEFLLRAASPTLEEAVLLDLVRLRIETLRLPCGVLEIEIEVETGPADREQLRLFVRNVRRDLRAGERALARLRAQLGADCIVRAVLRDGHLPEATFAWEPLEELRPAAPGVVRLRPLVRRLYTSPLALPFEPLHERHQRDDEWIADTSGHGRIQSMLGPYIVSGGWWHRRIHREIPQEVHREYHYASTEDGELLWVYYDRRRRRWFLHGRVE